MNVFVSYQRADTAMAAHALFYALRLGGHQAYVDTGDIGAGEFYRQVIANAVAASNVLLGLIGPTFNAARLGEPTSVVTFEWQRARFHGAAVVPVLVDGGGRQGSSDRSTSAGAAFLDQPVVREGGPPVIVYAGTWAVAQRADLVRRGALDVMANREALIATVLETLGRVPDSSDDLER